MAIGKLLPDEAEPLAQLARMELRHMKGFQSCARNLSVEPDMPFAQAFFAPLHANFQAALADDRVATCLVIQALMIEAFAIAAYHIYIPVADPFARRITEAVVKDESTRRNYGQTWLKAHFEECREEIETAHRANLPIIRSMLEQVSKEDLIEDFLIAYQEALTEIGFNSREIARMAAAALVG